MSRSRSLRKVACSMEIVSRLNIHCKARVLLSNALTRVDGETYHGGFRSNQHKRFWWERSNQCERRRKHRTDLWRVGCPGACGHVVEGWSGGGGQQQGLGQWSEVFCRECSGWYSMSVMKILFMSCMSRDMCKRIRPKILNFRKSLFLSPAVGKRFDSVSCLLLNSESCVTISSRLRRQVTDKLVEKTLLLFIRFWYFPFERVACCLSSSCVNASIGLISSVFKSLFERIVPTSFLINESIS